MDRGHSTHLADVASMIAWINASIIQGSVVGPPSYVVAASDLHPKRKQNVITKFADDTYQLVGSGRFSTVAAELDNSWAEANNVAIHPSKTKELVVYRVRRRSPPDVATTIIEGAERVLSLRVLGVILDSKLSMAEYITAFLNTCSSSTYALRLLRSHGLQPRELHLVARATTVASMLYAAPAWWGFAGEGVRQRLERLIARMQRSGYLPSDFPDLATLVEEADCKLYTNVRRSNTHVLRHYFIEQPVSTRLLRERAYNFVLPLRDNRNFI